MMNFIRAKCPRERERERDVASRLRCVHDRECRTEESEWSGEDVYDYRERWVPMQREWRSWVVPNFGVRSTPIPKLHNQRGIWNYSPLCIDWTWQMGIRHACGECNHLVTEVAA